MLTQLDVTHFRRHPDRKRDARAEYESTEYVPAGSVGTQDVGPSTTAEDRRLQAVGQIRLHRIKRSNHIGENGYRHENPEHDQGNDRQLSTPPERPSRPPPDLGSPFAMVGDMFLVTETGSELLAQFPREIFAA